MAKFIDKNDKVVDISMYDDNGTSWEEDFFTVGNLNFRSIDDPSRKEYKSYQDVEDIDISDDDIAYSVEDVGYLLNQMQDNYHGCGDYNVSDKDDSDTGYAVVQFPKGETKTYDSGTPYEWF